MDINVYALDNQGYELAHNSAFSTVAEAKSYARSLITDKELIASGLHKIELHVNGECTKDWFVKSK